MVEHSGVLEFGPSKIVRYSCSGPSCEYTTPWSENGDKDDIEQRISSHVEAANKRDRKAEKKADRRWERKLRDRRREFFKKSA